jgi:hypothetical protein
MIAKRIGAAALAIALIVVAWFVRDRVIDGDRSAEPAASDATVYCVKELRAACQSAATTLGNRVQIVFEDAAETLDRLTNTAERNAIWVTLAPFPEMIEAGRRLASPLSIESITVAESPLSLVVDRGSTATLRQACPTLDWECIGRQGGLKPTFAPARSAIGAVSLATALEQFGGPGVSFAGDDFELLAWARNLKDAGQSSLSGDTGTAISTIQTRRTFAIAVGAEAELSNAYKDSFDVIYPVPMSTFEVVVASVGDASSPSGFRGELTKALMESGWGAPTPATAGDDGPPSAPTVLAAVEYWEQL